MPLIRVLNVENGEWEVVASSTPDDILDIPMLSIDIPIKKLNNNTLREVFGNRNHAMPDLTGKEYLGDGEYKLIDIVGVDIFYNVYSGIFTFNGVSAGNSFVPFLFFSPLNGYHSFATYYVSGTVSDNFRFYFREPAFGYIRLVNGENAIENNLIFNGQTQLVFNTNSTEPITFDNYKIKLQLEKGTTATPYQVPTNGPYNDIDLGQFGLSNEELDYYFKLYEKYKNDPLFDEEGKIEMVRLPELPISKITNLQTELDKIPIALDDILPFSVGEGQMLVKTSVGWDAIETFGATMIPGLDADKITSGTFDVNRIPLIPIEKVDTLEVQLSNLNQYKADIQDIPTSLPNPHALTIKRNNTTLGTYNGDSAETINITDTNNYVTEAGFNGQYLSLEREGLNPLSVDLTGLQSAASADNATRWNNYRMRVGSGGLSGYISFDIG